MTQDKTLTPKELHDRAMEFASLAYIARQQGKQQEAINYAEKALALEAQAARSLPPGPKSEPTRSILFLGAASLAYQARQYQHALHLIEEGASRYTPENIYQDFIGLRDDIRFDQHLQESGLELSPEEALVILKGPTVGWGTIYYKEFLQRLSALVTLVQRTAERLSFRQYRKGGRSRLPIEAVVALAPPGSFGFKLSIATPTHTQLSMLVDGQRIINEILHNLELVTHGTAEKLRTQFAQNLDQDQADAYLRNFLVTTKRLAPDGQKIETVSIALRHQAITLTADQQQSLQILLKSLVVSPEDRDTVVTVTGELDVADKRQGEIQITEEETQRRYKVRVQKGLEELVRTHFGEKVTIKGVLRGEVIHLYDVEPTAT